jgi:hypothetical protein
MLYITKITTSFINNEITHIIKNNIKNILYDQDNKAVKPTLSLGGINNDIINMYTSLIIKQIKDMIDNDPTIQSLKLQNASLVEQLSKSIDTNFQTTTQNNIVNISSQINTHINNIIKNFPYSYYIKIFSQQESFSQKYNQDLFK